MSRTRVDKWMWGGTIKDQWSVKLTQIYEKKHYQLSSLTGSNNRRCHSRQQTVIKRPPTALPRKRNSSVGDIPSENMTSGLRNMGRSMYLMIERWKRYWPKGGRMIPRILYVSIHISYVSWHVLSWNINVIKAAPLRPTATLCIESKRSRLGCAWYYSRLQGLYWVITVKDSLVMEESFVLGCDRYLWSWLHSPACVKVCRISLVSFQGQGNTIKL